MKGAPTKAKELDNFFVEQTNVDATKILAGYRKTGQDIAWREESVDQNTIEEKGQRTFSEDDVHLKFDNRQADWSASLKNLGTWTRSIVKERIEGVHRKYKLLQDYQVYKDITYDIPQQIITKGKNKSIIEMVLTVLCE